uniref:DUF6857 domain-containing protein n=1 Tax=Rhizophora mucronata TaxID=61149 RepID=A0A2P2JVA9_RHIMU
MIMIYCTYSLFVCQQNFPVHSSRYDSSDGNSSTKMKRSSIFGVGARSSKLSRKSCISGSGKKGEDSADPKVTSSSASDKSLTDAKKAWKSLPSNLVKLGQEVLKQRDIALLSAAEALQEASAAERLLKCLSLFSELQSGKGDDQHLSVDKFFGLQDSLAQTRLVVQSLTSASPLRTTHNDPSPPSSVKDALKLALERKQNATLWIKTALALDLNLASDDIKTVTAATETTGEAKNSNKKGHSGKPKGEARVRRQRSNGVSDVGLAADLDSQAHWVKGSALSTSMELANSLQEDCRVWFLTYVEDYLDWVGGQMACKESDGQVAEMMYQIKRVSDWLDMRCKETSSLNDSDVQAYCKVRNKIYEILLKHAERIAMNAIGEF